MNDFSATQPSMELVPVDVSKRQRKGRRRLGFFLLSLVSLVSLVGCDKAVNTNDLPVSHWADPKSIGADGFGYADACSVASAQAIVKAGLPFPNYGTKDELAVDGNTINKRINTVDVWLGGVRFVFPAELVSSGGYPAHNPNRFNGLQGTLPHFYPTGPHAPVKDGMSSMVDVKFVCSVERPFTSDREYRSNAEGVQRVVSTYEMKLLDSPSNPGVVTTNIRKDLGMTEVALERKDLQPEATYFPINRELTTLEGGVNGIGCQARNESAGQKAYGGRGWRCGTAFRVNSHIVAGISIYVSHVDQMPDIYDQVQQVVTDAKRAAE